MKKMVLAAGAVLALGGLCYLGGRLWAQAPAGQAAAAAPRTHVALLNLTYVIKNYTKYKNFQEEIKTVLAPFQDKDTKLRQEAEGLRKQAEGMAKTGSTDAASRERIEKRMKDLQRELEDNSAEAKVVLGKKSDDVMRQLYMEVYEAATRYATDHDFDMVLHYNDALTKEDFFSAPNIGRKLNTGALMPLYWQGNMDISQALVEVLNHNVTPAAAGAPAGGTAGGTH